MAMNALVTKTGSSFNQGILDMRFNKLSNILNLYIAYLTGIQGKIVWKFLIIYCPAKKKTDPLQN